MEQKISIGSVLKPQGIRGEVKVKVFLDSAEELKSFKRVLIGGEEYAVMRSEERRVGKECDVLC